MVATEIRLDLNGKKGPDLWARLGESDTRQIVMHPGYYDPEGNWTPLTIDAENIFAKFRIVKPDNTFVIQDASLYLPSDPSIFVVTLPETATQVAGLGYYDLRIGDGETPDTFLYSAGGRFIIDDDMITDEMIASVASVNGLVFPDDFLTSADLNDYVKDDELSDILDDYATKTYVDDAIAGIDVDHVYSTTPKKVGTWVNGKDIMEVVIPFSGSISTTGTSVYYTLPYGSVALSAQAVNTTGHGNGGAVSCAPLVLMEWNANDHFDVYSAWSWNVAAQYIVVQYIVP